MSQALKIVIPMAGAASRLRPLTWSRPKPLVSMAGATVMDHMLHMFATIPNEGELEYAFILSPGQEPQIRAYMQQTHPKKKVHYIEQPEKKGQSDALWHARVFFDGPALMVFSDTLIETDFSVIESSPGISIAWVKPVPDPRRFGVAEVNSQGQVTHLIEKPNDVNNNLALVGAYYFHDGRLLINAIEEQVRRKIQLKNEYFLADAINLMLEAGVRMRTERVETWLDAGTLDALIETNRWLLEHGRASEPSTEQLEGNTILPPVAIHPEAQLSGATIGPHVSIGAGAFIKNSTIKDSILAPGVHVQESHLEGSLLGHDVVVSHLLGKFNLGDNSSANG